MESNSKTIRVFISSTFSDMELERYTLHEWVFPRLKKYCQRRGWSFQAIDLRWGISTEAALDKSTMRICKAEIARCQEVTPKPNFIILLGDRYGWKPLPDEIPAAEFEALLPYLPGKLAKKWYKLDKNAVIYSPEGKADKGSYILQPRRGEYRNGYLWLEKVEKPLGDAFRLGVQLAGFPEDKRIKYEWSATAQEIFNGALSIPDASEHVAAFFREIVTADGTPLREALPDESSFGDFIDFKDGHPDFEAGKQLQALKIRLRDYLGQKRCSTYQVKWEGKGTGTAHIPQFCSDVYRSLLHTIKVQIKQQIVLSSLEEERCHHKEFAKQRACDFTGRTLLLNEMMKYLNPSNEPVEPLVIHGVSGSGKSALLAKVIAELESGEAKQNRIIRFVGATANSTDPILLLDDLCRELGELYEADNNDLPKDHHTLAQLFRERLAMASADKPLLVFIDAIDQLQTPDLPDPLWLPEKLPPFVKLVVSVTPGATMDSLQKRLSSHCFLELGQMSLKDSEALFRKWLLRAGRRLSRPEQWKTIQEGIARCSLPLYLRLVFEEAKNWKSYNKVSLNRFDVDGMIERLFERLSEPSNYRALLTNRAISYLRCSRHGLSENEMIGILSADKDYWKHFHQSAQHDLPVTKGKQKRQLPVVIWSRLYNDLEPYLSWRNSNGTGLMVFFHARFNEVADNTFLPEKNVLLERHRQLATYFEGIEVGARKLNEWPYQLYSAEMWDKLASCISRADVFEVLGGDTRVYELDRYWMHLKPASHVLSLCKKTLSRLDEKKSLPENSARYAQEVGRYLSHNGEFAEAEKWLNDARQRFEQAGEKHLLAYADLLRHLGSFYMHAGQPAEAEPVFEKALEILNQQVGPDFAISAVVLSLLAEIRRNLGKYEQALVDYQSALPRLEKAIGLNHIHVATVKSNYAGLLVETGDFSNAEKLYREAVITTGEILGPNHPQTMHILNNLASTLVHAGKPAEAEPLHWKALNILTEAIGSDNPYTLTVKMTLAYALSSLLKYEEAENITREVIASSEKMYGSDHHEVATAKEFLASLMVSQGKYTEAEKLYLEALPVLEKWFGIFHRLTADCLNQLAQLYHTIEKYIEAEPYYRKAIEIYTRVLGKAHVRTINAQMSLGHLLAMNGKVDESVAIYQQAIQVLEETNNIHNTTYVNSVHGYGIALRKKKNYPEAEQTLKRAISLYEELLGAKHPQTGICLKTLGDLYEEQGQFTEAEKLFEQAYSILSDSLGAEHPTTIKIGKEPLDNLRKRSPADAG